MLGARSSSPPGLSGPPTRWDQIRRDDATRVPNLAPVVMTNALPSTMPVQMYFGRGVGATHMYDVGLAPGLAPATPVEMTLESGKMSSYFSIPGTPGQPDRVTAHSIGTANKAVSLRLPAGSQAKQVSWTVSGPQKQRWAELTQLGMNPSQTLRIRLENAGYNLVYDNDGPATQAHLRVKAGPGANPVDVGLISIPGGHTTFQFQLPVTTLALGNVVNGLAGWLVADPTVTLTAVDYSGTGIAAIEYGRDGAHWTTYAGTFTYTDEGDTFLFYRARDNAQDQELAKSQELKVDTRSPDVSVFTDQASYTRTQGFVVHFSASDPAPGSGLSVVNATLDAQVVTAGQAVDLLFFALGSHTLQVTATDVAGWSTTRATTFTIIATIDSLPDLIRELRRRGEIDSDGIMQSFLAKALAAQSAAARGNRTPAINELNALLNDVAAQSGKHITTRAANLLSGDVRYVIATLP